MSSFHIPPWQIDPRALPPPLMNSEEGSFAHQTMQVRVPAIIRETNTLNQLPQAIQDALEALAREIESGPVRLLQEDAPDRAFWHAAWGDDAGRPWLEAPWYLSESYAYRRILEATRYFQPGPWQGLDPFRAKKLAELDPAVAPRLVEVTLGDLPDDRRARFEILLFASLWGNRIDLSYAVSAQIGRAARLEDERVNLLVNDTDRVWDFVTAQPRRRWVMIADNAGTELLMDLAFIDFLLVSGLAARVDLHLKPQPFFVSDAMIQDAEASLDALARGGARARALAERIRQYLVDGRLRWSTHWLYATCLFYFQLPDDLRVDLASADFVVLKGDANYRRLVGDAHWPPTSSFGRATAYFPAPLVALRTLKSELILGLRPGEAERLQTQDPHWRVNGRRGIVQARL